MGKGKKGVAIGYSPGMRVPKILAQARGFFVERLLQIAKENDITIYRDPDLTEVLSAMKEGDDIPEYLFRAVAEVLAYCYEVNDKFREKIVNRTV